MRPEARQRIANRPLWVCPVCGKQFVNRNSWHSCGTWSLEWHFADRPVASALFAAVRAAVERDGPVTLVLNKSGIGFMTRVRYAGVFPRQRYVRVGFWLKRAIDSPRIAKREFLPPGEWIHEVVVREVADVDDELIGWLREARRIGDQEHLRDRASG